MSEISAPVMMPRAQVPTGSWLRTALPWLVSAGVLLILPLFLLVESRQTITETHVLLIERFDHR